MNHNNNIIIIIIINSVYYKSMIKKNNTQENGISWRGNLGASLDGRGLAARAQKQAQRPRGNDLRA